MRLRFSASLAFHAVVLGVILLALSTAAAAQKQKSTTLPRTADGHPDIQGFWTNATFTPFERPEAFANKEFFTEAEAAAFEQKRLQDEESQPQDDIHYDNVLWQREKLQKEVSNRRTSIVVDPPDGRIPTQTPQAKQRLAARAEARKQSDPSDVEARTLQEQCIIWAHVGPPMVPAGYNNTLQIVQGAGYVMILQEMIHDVRIIPLDGRPHLPSNIRRWMGDSIGRWEGDTLVVDTTNFTDRTNYRGSTDALHVVERFTRVDADTIRYAFTIEDPKTWAQPWTGELNIRKFPDPVFEYACHEGNHDLEFLLDLAKKGLVPK